MKSRERQARQRFLTKIATCAEIPMCPIHIAFRRPAQRREQDQRGDDHADGGCPTNMPGLLSVGVGVSVLPYFEQMERLRGIVWRPLRPAWFWDSALVWRREKMSRAAEEFISLAAKQFPPPAESQRAAI